MGRDAVAAEVLRCILDECRRVLTSREATQQAARHYFLERILHYIDEHLTEDINCKQVGRNFGINPNYITNLFRRHLGGGFASYINSRRLELAMQYLMSSNLNINEIAALCGYRSTNYFIRVFKKIRGVTPYKYRN